MKELIFGRIETYNLIQMFQFVTVGFETYMKRKLLSIAHNRFDNFIPLNIKVYQQIKLTNLLLRSRILLINRSL